MTRSALSILRPWHASADLDSALASVRASDREAEGTPAGPAVACPAPFWSSWDDPAVTARDFDRIEHGRAVWAAWEAKHETDAALAQAQANRLGDAYRPVGTEAKTGRFTPPAQTVCAG